MTGVKKTLTIHRISVALDCSPYSKTSLMAAAELAGLLQAELHGVFVEDINLLRMAELPFSHEIHLRTARSEPLDTIKMERLLQLQAKKAHELFKQAAMRFGVPHTFRILRGLVPSEVLAATLESDLLAMGRSGRTPVCRRGLGSTARKAIEEAKTNLLLTRADFRRDSPLLVLFDGSPGAKHALEAALDLASKESTLHVFLVGKGNRNNALLQHEAEKVIGESAVKKEFHTIPWTDSDMLVRCINMTECGLLILSNSNEAFGAETVYRLIDTTEYPVLLVRSHK